MKLIIDIPKNAYDLLQGEGVDWLGTEHILDAVSNGTPLSESEDCVSREAAIKAICRYCTPEKPERCPTAEICHSYQELKALPPVAPQPKVGQWIEHETDDGRSWLECPVCHIKKQYPITNYCPKCGSRNTEKDEPDDDGWIW